MKDVPVDLQEQWERDRLKKAERKRLREEQRKQGLLTKKTKKKDKANGQPLDLESIEAHYAGPGLRHIAHVSDPSSITQGDQGTGASYGPGILSQE
jgi:hypothetical protein